MVILKPHIMHEMHSRLCLMNTRQELIEQLLHRILSLIETILGNIQRATASHHNGHVTWSRNFCSCHVMTVFPCHLPVALGFSLQFTFHEIWFLFSFSSTCHDNRCITWSAFPCHLAAMENGWHQAARESVMADASICAITGNSMFRPVEMYR